MSPGFIEHDFADRGVLAHALAADVAGKVRAAIDERGVAMLALSGGTTPLRFLRELAAQRLDWMRVVVTPCDERWVPPDHERSNARLIRENLLHGAAAAARFVPLYVDAPEPEQAAADVARHIDALPLPFDVLVLGLGGDGHTLSWFPGGDRLAQAIDPRGATSVLPMRAPGAGEPRITLTLPVVAAARAAYLHIEGAEKKRVFDAIARGSADFRTSPLHALLENASVPLAVYWSS
jgi:6-phosphogluconolactonase